MTLKILSWNIWCDCDFGEVCSFLKRCDADIIGLQEIVPNDKDRDVVGFLAGLGYEHFAAPIGATFPDGRMITSGVFSKYPIQNTRAHALSVESPRQAAEVAIRFKDTTLTVFSFHLKHTHQQESPLQNEQVENVIKVLPAEKVVVMGDFNATPEMTPIRRMREMLLDTDPSSLPTLNAPMFDCADCDRKLLPTTRLDYIFTSHDLKTHLFMVHEPSGSDHLPISVTVEL